MTNIFVNGQRSYLNLLTRYEQELEKILLNIFSKKYEGTVSWQTKKPPWIYIIKDSRCAESHVKH